jgi:YD repeat-containing protein
MKQLFLKESYLYSFILIYVLSTNLKVYSQIPQRPTPNVASLGTFAQYPPSNFTGVPDIQIPVYNFVYQGLSLPIYISYNTNNVKPFVYSSWVGQGWNLTAGGVINRVVNDKADDVKWWNASAWILTGDLSVGYFYNHSSLSHSDWATAPRIEEAIYDMNHYNLQNIATNYGYTVIKDYCPDEFSFSIGDLSGTFYMDDSGNWKVRSRSKVRIEPSNSNDFVERVVPPLPGYFGHPDTPLPNNTYLNRITMTDTKGIKYIFGGAGSSVEFVNGREGFIKSWWVTAIIFPNGKKITFNYENGGIVTTQEPVGIAVHGGSPIVYSGQSSSSAYLKTIVTDDKVITFSRSGNLNEFAQLNEITVEDKILQSNNSSGNFLKYEFEYQNTPMNKLKLINFYQKDNNNQVNNKYSFSYNSLAFSQNANTDHWGYNNSKPAQVGNILASRDADTANCRAELLKSVIYPTKGYTTYTWEPNDYSQELNSERNLLNNNTNKNAGGVRIKQVTNYGINNDYLSFKKYFYLKNYSLSNPSTNSSGILYQTPDYGQDPYTYFLTSSYPLTDMNTGSHITYSEVTEVNMDGSFKVNKYSNFDNGVNNEYLDQQPDFYENSYANPNKKFNFNNHERGQLLNEASFNNIGTLIHNKSIQYARIDKTNAFVKAYSVYANTRYGQYGEPLFTEIEGSAFRIYTNAYLPSTITETLFFANAQTPTTKITSYTYDPTTLNVTNVTINNSKGELQTTKYRYVNDLFTNITPAQNVPAYGYPYSFMFNNNMISTPIETIQSVNRNGAETIVGANLTKYQGLVTSSGIYPNYIVGNMAVPLTSYKWNSSIPKSSFTNYGISIDGTGEHDATIDPQMKPAINYQEWDNSGYNLLQYTKEGGLPTSIQWGYNSLYPVAECKNALKDEFFYDGFEGNNTLVITNGPSHTGKSYCSQAYTATWIPPNSRSYLISYWYSNAYGVWTFMPPQPYTPNYTLPYAWLGYDDIKIYPADAELSTYTYDPFGGIASITDAKDQTTYYEYDTFYRLITVRDQSGNILKHNDYHYHP